MAIYAKVESEAQMPRHKGSWFEPIYVIQGRVAHSAELKNIFKTRCCDKAHPCTAPLENCIGRDCSSVEDSGNVCGNNVRVGHQLAEPTNDRVPELRRGRGAFSFRSELSSPTRTRSVNVPPISTPMRKRFGCSTCLPLWEGNRLKVNQYFFQALDGLFVASKREANVPRSIEMSAGHSWHSIRAQLQVTGASRSSFDALHIQK